MPPKTYIVATTKPWNIRAFHKHTPKLTGKWVLIDQPEQLTLALLKKHSPRYVFFPHWSWKVQPEILDAVECVCFHMTDLPYGRGGSPLQNLIVRGHTDTTLTALRMIDILDAGPIYLQRDLELSGSAESIFERSAILIFNMIEYIIAHEPAPKAQEGDITAFQRRTPEQSALPHAGDIKNLYDHIRMLDAPGYPHAFIEYGQWHVEFGDATFNEDTQRLSANVLIRKKN